MFIYGKTSGKYVVRYVGQTGSYFRKRLKWELSLQNEPVSIRFRQGLKKHIGKNLFTVFFDENEISEMVKGVRVKGNFRFLVEQAMLFAYNSDDLLNENK